MKALRAKNKKAYLEFLLSKELKRLNGIIDAKVIMGLPYTREAREHRLITARLIGLRRAHHPWLTRLSSFGAFFL